MIDPLGALIFIGLLGLGTGILVGALVVWLANYVADYRCLAREDAAYAEAYVRARKAREAAEIRNRYLTADERRPE